MHYAVLDLTCCIGSDLLYISVHVHACSLIVVKLLCLALELCSELPPLSKVDRWCGEPLKTIVLSTDLFMNNKRGYPVLSRIHQAFMEKVFKVIEWLERFHG